MCEGGGGIGDWLESPVETHLILVVPFLHVLFLFLYGWGGGGLTVDIVCFIELKPEGRCNRRVFRWTRFQWI